MGLFDFLKKRRDPPESAVPAQVLSGYMPVFSQYGQDIYMSDVVQQAVACVVHEMKKLRPRHVRSEGPDAVSVPGPIQAVLDAPNPVMTTSDMLEKITWSLYLNYNAFVIPQWSPDGRLEALWPVQPSAVTFLQDASGTMYVQFAFPNLYQCTLRYDDIIHIRMNYSVAELMGGDAMGQPDHKALLKTLELNDVLLQGVSKALKSSFAINGVVKYNTLMDDGKMDAALRDLSEHLANSEDGFLAMDLKGEFVPIKRDAKVVDEATLKFVDEKILRYFGVPLSILTGEFDKDTYESFFQKTLEPLIISYSQAFTRTLFTRRESYGFGNRVTFYAEELIFMTMTQKLELVRLLGDSGALYENEKREIFGLAPLEELKGVRKQSLNYVDSDKALTYQMQGRTETMPIKIEEKEEVETDVKEA
jgi:HK97 family phage portal protein